MFVTTDCDIVVCSVLAFWENKTQINLWVYQFLVVGESAHNDVEVERESYGHQNGIILSPSEGGSHVDID